jgi:hypothetical protein
LGGPALAFRNGWVRIGWSGSRLQKWVGTDWVVQVSPLEMGGRGLGGPGLALGSGWVRIPQAVESVHKCWKTLAVD